MQATDVGSAAGRFARASRKRRADPSRANASRDGAGDSKYIRNVVGGSSSVRAIRHTSAPVGMTMLVWQHDFCGNASQVSSFRVGDNGRPGDWKWCAAWLGIHSSTILATKPR